jgi:hypothetical protein
LLGGAFPKRHRANCGVIAIIRKVPILGRHKWYSVKTIFLKMRLIVLSRSAFYSLPLCFSPLTFAGFESSLLPSSSFRIPRGLDDLLPLT